MSDALKGLFDEALAQCLATRYSGTSAVDDAVRYVLEAGGKRVRPMLCLLSAEAVGGDPKAALASALALEFVHTYSLVHDDLPCMDNDDFRRGKPTAHKVFGEAHALLAGDALLTDSFALLAEHPRGLPLVQELATGAGGAGMVLGQSLDLHWTARSGAGRKELDEIHLKKTGYLLGAACAMGALAGGAPLEVAARFRRFGRSIGLAFQILDDLLDDLPGTGKSAGKDQASGKLTYLALMSREAARSEADRYTAEAIAEITAPGLNAAPLVAFARGLLTRKS